MTEPADELLPRLRVRDLVGSALLAVHTRPVRTLLTTIGVAIGIAAITGVLGISASSRADLLAELDSLGTDLLRVRAGSTLLGERSQLPESSTAMLGRMGEVEQAEAVTGVAATVRRTDFISELETGGIAVFAAGAELAETIGAEVAQGRLLTEAHSELPGVVLGSVAARRLGIRDLDPPVRIVIGGSWFSVVGILEPSPLTPEIDRAALIGPGIAATLFGTELAPTTVYVRIDPSEIEEARERIPITANPEFPSEVEVERPSDAVRARAAADTAFTSLLAGLGVVALFVAGVGIANVMVISVMERRSEIGLRRALGATRTHIRLQFMLEASVLAAIGGLLGVLIGVAVTVLYAQIGGSVAVLPLEVAAGAFGASMLVGLLAGAYPAARAAGLEPVDALRPGGA
jgi:putative ABC transport system permease protein